MRKYTVIILIIILLAGCSSVNIGEPKVYNFISEKYSNSYIIASQGKAAVVDPSGAEEIIKTLKANKLKPVYILLTHGHFDHIQGIDELIKEYPNVEIFIHPADLDKLADQEKNLSMMFGTRVTVNVKTKPLTQETRLELGGFNFEVIETPGHTEGSVCMKIGKLLVSGDTLFKGSVGRTDFPGSDQAAIKKSLLKLMSLPDETRVLPGHGDLTVLGTEKKTNPYL